MSASYGGVVAELASEGWLNPDTGERVRIPHKSIEIRANLDGAEAQLCREMHGNKRYCVVGDEITMDVLGNRVRDRLTGDQADVFDVVLKRPKTDMETVTKVRELTQHAEAVIAVGSGSVSDLCKYATFLDGKEYSVFPTSPMNAYSTNTASITDKGAKLSLAAHNAQGVFFDLAVLAACPDRLVANAFADVVCRTTAQVDWLISKQILGSDYSELPYTLMAIEEEPLLAAASKLPERDLDSLACLVRMCVLNGLTTAFVGTTHAGSQAEHMISHYLDMFTGDAHPGSLHGEQVGVTTLSVLELQNHLLGAKQPPQLVSLKPDATWLQEKFGKDLGSAFQTATTNKTLDEAQTAQLNERLAANWDLFVAPLRMHLLAVSQVLEPMNACGAITSATKLGFSADTYRDAVSNARFMRDRYTILDLAASAGTLDDFVANEMTL